MDDTKSELGKQNKISNTASPSNLSDNDTKKSDTFLKFDFQLDSISVSLMHSPSEGLACFGIHYFSLKGNKLVDGSLSTSIILCDMQLDDGRPDRENKITR